MSISADVLQLPSPNHSARRGCIIDTLIFHWTGGVREPEAVARVDYRRKDEHNVSAHVTIGRAGLRDIVQSVSFKRAAWAAGGTRFLRNEDLVDGYAKRGRLWMPNTNCRSINIEVCNMGWLVGDRLKRAERHGFDMCEGHHRNPASRKELWEEYTNAQLEAIPVVAAWLKEQVPTLRYITGHEDILNNQHKHTKGRKKGKGIGAKLDPGPDFPWWETKWPKGMWPVRWDYSDRDWVHWMDVAS